MRPRVAWTWLGLAALSGLFSAQNATAQAVPGTCPASFTTQDFISHDFSSTGGGATVSYCELCGTGTIRLEIENPYSPSSGVGDLVNIVVEEDLLSTGLRYVPGSTTFSTDNVSGGPPPVVEPSVSGSVLTWTIDPNFALPERPGGSSNRARLYIEFQVESATPGVSEEDLINAVRTIQASVTFEPDDCGLGDTYTDSTGPEVLPLREPVPVITKEGRNVDANQTGWASTVYGHRHDNVIWRIEVENSGLAPLEDVVISDVVGPGFEFNYACPSNGTAGQAAAGSPPANCDPLGATDTVTDLVLADVLGVAGSTADPGETVAVYLVGKMTDSCIIDSVNTIYDVGWGCQVEPPPGGILQTSTGITPGDTATFNTNPTPADLDVDVALTGTNLSQPMGSKGTVTVTVSNQTGGTVRDIRLRDLLPAEYVIDPTFEPTVTISRPGGFGATYDGMIDTITWTNPQAGTFPLTSTNPADPLANTELTFELTSSTFQTITDPDPDATRYRNMLRHGDVMTVRFRTILIDPTYYDKVAHIDVAEENPASDPPGTDPTESFEITNELEIWFDELCTNTEHNPAPLVTVDDAEPEDIDIDTGAGIYVLTNTDPTPLTVELTNHGGHDADDYHAYVSFGNAMVVDTAPSSCTATTNMPTIRGADAPLWQLPEPLPPSASVYVCDVGVIGPGDTETLTFDVVKNPDPSAEDDLLFRADVIGEITLSNPDENGNQALWFPAPTQRLPDDGLFDRANDYTLDALRARVIGFNLTKAQLGVCSENNPPPGTPDDEIQIGEECTFHIESGGWFGFNTTGYNYIGVWDIAVDDLIPNGQGYISQEDPVITPQINNIGLTPPPEPVPVSEGTFGWVFNTADVDAERIDVKDEWFFVDTTTRLLNDPVDTSAVPNLHAETSTNTLLSTFEAIFENPLTGEREYYDIDSNVIGYPPEFRRRVDLTVTEPRLTVTKEVCNEDLYGVGPSCSNFVPLADDGDAYDTYIYRITIENEASADGVTRAPAYDVTVTSVTDPTDLLYVDPLTGDLLDNDGDTLEDGSDAAGEGTITDNTTQNAIPAEVIASYTHSDALERIDPGDSVVLYYRVDPDDDVAPLQQLVSSVTATYDSLEGDFGNQTDPQLPNSDIGGARVYETAPAQATIRIIPVEVVPKQIIALSNTPSIAPATPQPVSIGEEVEFELRAMIPVSQLRNFTIRDELPAGMSCAEAPDVDLDSPPYDAGGFVPGGIITPTCTDTEVVWDFGDQTVTQAPGGATRFDFGIQFIARIDNSAANRDGVVITNGGAATVTRLSYIDEGDNLVTLDFEAAEVVIAEPVIELEKVFGAADADAGDIVTVTINATNNGPATAYNLRVLDELTGVDLSFADQVAGANPPDVVDTTTYGPDSPLFSWSPGFAIAPGETISFEFAVRVGDLVEPHQVLPNTAQADWTSLPSQATALNSSGTIGPNGDATGMRIGALPNAGDTLNDYETEASDDIVIRTPTMQKIDVDPALAPEIGAHKPFRIEIDLSEGRTEGVSVADSLDFGAASYVLADNADFFVSYAFTGITSINGQPPDVTAFNAVPSDGASGTIVWDIGTVVTESEDDNAAAPALDPTITIDYYARINNDLVTDAGDALQNSVDVHYLNGETNARETLSDTTDAAIVIEPVLTATKTIANVSPGKAAADPLELNDLLQYTITIDNGGSATAYDINVVDTLPLELALYDGFVPTAAINGVPVPGFIGLPAGAPDGPLVWGRGNGDETLDLPAGAFLELTYQVLVRAQPDDGTPLANNVWTDWTSLTGASVYERTGDGCPAWTAPNDYCYGPAIAEGDVVAVLPPEPLLKANTQSTASIGEVFSYRITVPAVPYSAPLYDVRIFDDLAASAADLDYVSITKISGSGAWVPTNTGSGDSLVIEDPVAGIDIPPNEQVVIEVTVVVEDTPTNVDGLQFTNTATYTYNRLDGNPASERPGYPGTSEPMTIVEPELTLTKTGPAQMRKGLPALFTLDVHNSTAARAWGVEITDVLPNTSTGGMCDAAPQQVSVQVFEADGVTAVSDILAEGTDYTLSFVGDPDCTLTLVMQSAAATVGPDERLIVTYEASLDLDSQQDATLTNVGGATQWYSADPSNPDAPARTYTRVLTDGTVGVLDHEDAHTVTVNLPVLRFEKTVANVTRGEDPGALATPGDMLHYTLHVENLSDVALDDFAIVDELDRLNATPAFAAGTLNIITMPSGADASATNASGGGSGTGLIDIRNLSLPGTVGGSLSIEFEVMLAPVIANGTFVYNQSQLSTAGITLAESDDPNINGPADPAVVDDDDPTQIQIESAPYFNVDKVSAYVTGDPSVLLAGETLQYTITVKNIGTDNAVDTMILDQVPANTTYVPNSTTLNGMAVPDLASGLAPLSAGLSINALEDPAPGHMRADASATPDNVATIVFSVVVDPNAIDGTLISNQAFVSAIAGGVSDQPSDDPRTPIVDDPTVDIVGALPIIYAEKSAALEVDLSSPNIVDPGDTLRYTIRIYNNGAVPATQVVLRDVVPANTTYIADSMTLNGEPVGQPDAGVSPLIGGVPVSSSDLTPPLPGAGDGTLSPRESAVLEFLLRVDDATPRGTLITNQAEVASYELPVVLTDGDGNPATGPEPTVVVVGDAQHLSITKTVAVVGGGPALPGATLEYTVHVLNVSLVPANYVVITDDLDMPIAGQLIYVDQSATMNGTADGVTFMGSTLTADYSDVYGNLPPSGEILLRFQAVLYSNLPMGTTVTNIADVKWDDPPQNAQASVSIDVGAAVGSGILSGTAWHDVNFDNDLDVNETELEGWTVELYRNDVLLRSTLTDSDGTYRISGVPPNYQTEDKYELRFIAPDAGPNTAPLGLADSDFTDYLQRIADIVVQPSSNMLNLNLPIDPNGVVYNSVARSPIAGAVLTLVDATTGAPLPSSCFDDPAQQNQITLADGFYKFDINFSDAACASGGDYVISVRPPSGRYTAGNSEIIPPISSSTGPFSVPACLDSAADAIPATPDHCEVQTSERAPPISVPARSAETNYYVNLTLDDSQPPGSSQIFNNHIPLDPDLADSVSISKTTPALNVIRGQLVPYTITVTNDIGLDLRDISIIDRIPAGFRYIEGSARIDDVPLEPTVVGNELTWSDLGIDGAGSHELQLLLAVGAGVTEGEFVNRAQVVHTLAGTALSAEATATVRLVPDPDFDCTDVTGKVFDDSDRDGVQDIGEAGLAGVRLVTTTGLSVTTDAYGRYHITCAIVPNEMRGSNFVLKLDDRTLPSGFRTSTKPVRIERATRGKSLRINFGASIFRVVGMDISDPIFEPGLTELRPQWRPRIGLLIQELQKGPAVLRLSYLADLEEPKLVQDRLDAVERDVLEVWRDLNCCYELTIEPEIFWRLGAPPKKPRERRAHPK